MIEAGGVGEAARLTLTAEVEDSFFKPIPNATVRFHATYLNSWVADGRFSASTNAFNNPLYSWDWAGDGTILSSNVPWLADYDLQLNMGTQSDLENPNYESPVVIPFPKKTSVKVAAISHLNDDNRVMTGKFGVTWHFPVEKWAPTGPTVSILPRKVIRGPQSAPGSFKTPKFGDFDATVVNTQVAGKVAVGAAVAGTMADVFVTRGAARLASVTGLILQMAGYKIGGQSDDFDAEADSTTGPNYTYDDWENAYNEWYNPPVPPADSPYSRWGVEPIIDLGSLLYLEGVNGAPYQPTNDRDPNWTRIRVQSNPIRVMFTGHMDLKASPTII